MSRLLCKVFSGDNYFVDFNIAQLGYEECIPDNAFGPAARNYFLFHYILSGKGTLYSTDDSGATVEYKLESGQGFLIQPKQLTTYIPDKDTPWTYLWVGFSGIKAQDFVARSGITYNYPVYIAYDMEECEKMKNEMFYLVNNADNPILDVMGHFHLFLNAFIASSSVQQKIPRNNMQDFYVNEALNYIERHYRTEMKVEDIAAFCNLDRTYLAKIFKNTLKTSPQDFIINYRMNKACELIKITNYTIKEICVMVGYPNLFNFSRAFKKRFGQSPSEWRIENKIR